jgi:threonine/homoserine efflux transporter RhtA
MIFLLLVQTTAVLLMIVGVMVLLIGGKELGFRNNVPAGLAEMALGTGVCWAGYELLVCWCGWLYGRVPM